MPTHFSAFISYRHCEPDATIAGHIQRQLEHYRIPKAIQKATGIKKIDRIFRDKEELPLSSNLGTDIEDALENSDFLIVICSPRLMDSAWCQREIALFLRNHSIDRVLTVLAEGEPQDVVPEILRTDREPLSCDYRMPLRKAREIELPRLAAAILGCRYDDLRQREKQYKARRRTAFFCVAMVFLACLSVYYYRTSQEIQKNYVQSLENQSKFLASEALELLDDSDRLTAISLALEALPTGEDDPRPWVPEAEYALSRAVNAYGSIEAVLAINAFHHDARVVDFFLSPDGDILVSWDKNSQIYVWDTQNFGLLNSFSPGLDLSYTPVLPLTDGRMLIGANDQAVCYDYLTGEKLWERTDVCCSDMVLSDDGSRIATSRSTTESTISILDTATGETIKELMLPDHIATSFSSLHPIAMSPDGRYLAMTFGSFQNYQVVVYDLIDDTTVISELVMVSIEAISFSETGSVLVAGHKEASNDSSASLMGLNFTSTTMMRKDVICLAPDSAQVIWSNAFTFYLAGFETSLTPALQAMEDGSSKEVACVSIANVCAIYDVATGELLQRLEMPDSAVSCEYKNGTLYWYLIDGSYASHRLGSTNVGAIRYFPEDVVDGKTNHGCFIRTSNSNRILLFRSTRDESWTGYENDVPMSYSYGAVAVSDDYLVVKAGYRDTYNCYDLKNRSYLQTLNISESSGQSILGMLPDSSKLAIGDSDTGSIVIMDLSTGQTEKTDLPFTPAEGFNSAEIFKGSIFLSGNQVSYLVNSSYGEATTLPDGTISVTLSNERDYSLWVANLSDGTHTVYPIPGEFEQYTPTPVLSVNSSCTMALITTRHYDENYSTISESVLLDMTTGENHPITDMAYGEYGELPAMAWSSDGYMLAIVSTDGIRIWNRFGDLQATIDTGNKEPLELYYEPDNLHLMVVCNDGTVYRYTVYGTLANSVDLYFYDRGLSKYTDFSWQYTAHGLLITADDVCTLVNTELWEPYCYVQNFVHYDENADSFCVAVNTENGMVLGAYQRLTTADLIVKAREILGENKLTDEQKTKYGLD